MATNKQRAAARENGKMGGRPTNAVLEARRRARERAQRVVLSEQEESVKFLVYVRDNPNAPLGERVRCALELLNRGEMPAKSASFHGIGSPDAIDDMLSSPKLVVLGRFEAKEGRDGLADGEVVEPQDAGEVRGAVAVARDDAGEE